MTIIYNPTTEERRNLPSGEEIPEGWIPLFSVVSKAKLPNYFPLIIILILFIAIYSKKV